jgi:CRP/FNR family transcriptional regulator, nitrogen fixation regulation protein
MEEHMLMLQAENTNGLARSSCHPNGRPVSQSSFERVAVATSTTFTAPRDTEIFGEGEPVEHFYRVVSGAVRTYNVLIDGRRQIDAFALPGDFFGFSPDNIHMLSADAIVDSRICAIKRSSVMVRAESDTQLARQIWTMTGSELRRVQAHVLLLIKCARERVAAFLLDMAGRMPQGRQIELPMGRQDIADYLGLTIETVSRMLSELEKHGAIALPNSRHVIVRDRSVLATCAG